MRERFERITARSGEHSIAALCAALRVSRSGYYAWRERAVIAAAATASPD